MPISVTKETDRKSCRPTAARIRFNPTWRSEAVREALKARAAPFAAMASVTASRPTKVVKTRPGWRGE